VSLTSHAEDEEVTRALHQQEEVPKQCTTVKRANYTLWNPFFELRILVQLICFPPTLPFPPSVFPFPFAESRVRYVVVVAA
jgi:hypothetical protein